MDIVAALDRIQATSFAIGIRDSLLIFPLLESVHVIGLAVFFGTIAVIDLRLLGLASTARSFERIAKDVFTWSWAAFALTATTGVLMFITNAVVYFNNTWFRAKVLLLVLAAINVIVFELTARRSVQAWDRSPAAPPSGKAVATLSLVIWVAVIFAGRMIGFTATRTSLDAPPPAEINFEDLLGLPAGGGAAPEAPPANE